MTDLFEAPIAVRAYSERPNREPLGSRPLSADAEASEWTMVFDCETTIDAVQRLRFGFFQVRRGDVLDREGVFYDAAALSAAEIRLLRTYTNFQVLELLTIAEFRTCVFR